MILFMRMILRSLLSSQGHSLVTLMSLSVGGFRQKRIPRELQPTAVHIRFKHISLAGMLFFSAILTQGCSVLAWVGIVCADVSTCSDVEFESFEHAWVAPP